MENQQHHTEIENLGGEPLEGSGFESEQPSSEDEIVITTRSGEQKGEAL